MVFRILGSPRIKFHCEISLILDYELSERSLCVPIPLALY